MNRLYGKNRKVLLIASAAVILLAAAVIAMGTGNFDAAEINHYLILSGLLVLTVLSLVIHAVINGLDIFEPLYLISLTYLQIFVIAPWIWLIQGRTSWMSFPVMNNLPLASFYFALGYAAFLLGYCIAAKRGLEKPSGVYEPDEHCRHLIVRFSAFLLMLALVGGFLSMYNAGKSPLFVLTLGRVRTDTGGGLFSAASGKLLFLTMFINMLIPAFLLLFAFQKKHRWLLVPVFVVIFLINVSDGFRYRILILVFAPLVYLSLAGKRKLNLTRLAILVLAAFMLVTVIGAWRNNIRSGTQLVSLNKDVLLSAYMPNIEVFFPFYRILSVVPEQYGYLNGRGYLYTFTVMVPRILWPDKPEPLERDILTLAFGETGMKSGPAYPNIGEFYIEFGVAGIMAGMFLFGLFSRWTASLYKSSRRNSFSLIGYAMLLPYYLQIVCRGHFASIFMEIVFTFGPLLAAVFLVNHRKPGR
jgi:oligosaccharide repeat unit polymerase